MKNKIVLFVSLLGGLLLACTKENLENCNVTHYLTFEYSKNSQHMDKFPDVINTLDVFVFDNNGQYVKQIADEGNQLHSGSYSMPVELPEGEYTFVVWGDARNSYTFFDKLKGIVHPLQLFTSAFDQARISLMSGTAVINKMPDNLFHGMVQKVVVGSSSSRHTTHIQLTKNTNLIRFRIKGLQNIVKTDPYAQIFVSCGIANGEYSFDNRVINQQSLIQYVPVDRRNENGDLVFQMKTLRLLSGMESHLIIHNTAKSEDLLNTNLIELLQLLPGVQTDEDLDVFDEYDIVISIESNLSVSISVNGYDLKDSDLEIQ